MFAGFNIIAEDKERFYKYYERGSDIYNEHKKIINKNLTKYINPDGSLNVSLIENDWFPEIDAHVFLSHSHSDLKFVVSFAGWLHEKFKINAFIDSSVWGNSDNLLKIIDEKYCVSSRNDDDNTTTYSYSLRNKSTSNVHMILYTALMKMIDKTECLMFINTPASIKWSDMISDESATASPWIYGEILASKLIKSKPPQERRDDIWDSFIDFEESVEGPSFEYNVDSNHLTKITDSDLRYFESHLCTTNPYYALNGFYRRKRIVLD